MTPSESQVPLAVVVQAGARDRYQVPRALAEGGLLDRLVTDLYWPLDALPAPELVASWLPRRLVDARYEDGLPSSLVQLSLPALAADLISRRRPVPWMRRKDHALGKAAGRRAKKANAALLAYSYYAHDAFNEVGPDFPHRLLFQLHPHPTAVRRVLSEERAKNPRAAQSLAWEEELRLPPGEFDALVSEAKLANGYLVASSYTAQTLVEAGADPGRIHVVPYGVDTASFAPKEPKPRPAGPLTVAFVGSLLQRKGLSYLFDAVRRMSTHNVKLLLCGWRAPPEDLRQMADAIGAELHIGRPRHEVAALLARADVFAFPSLAEGFGHVVLEALAAGLPVITTERTCGPDVIEEGRHGFIVKAGDSEALAARLDYCVDHRDELRAMGEAARARAGEFTWAKFREGIRAAYLTLVKS